MKTILKIIIGSIAILCGAQAQVQQQISNLAVTSKEIVGTTGTAATKLHIVDTGTETPRGIANDQYNAGTNSAQFNVRKARGTFATPTTIVSGDVLGRFLAWGHDGTNFIESGNIRFTSSGTIAATRVPSQFEVWTSTDATPSVLTKQLMIDNAGVSTFTGGIIGSGATNAFNVAAGVTPTTELEVDSTSTSSPRGIMTAQFNTGTDGARLHMRKARGTRASPTTVVTGDNLGRIVGTGYDGSSYLEDASIIFGTEGTVASTRVPTNIQFWTGTDAAPTVLTQALILKSDQSATFAKNITFGTAGSILSGTTGSQGITVTGNNESFSITPTGTGGLITTLIAPSASATTGAVDIWGGLSGANRGGTIELAGVTNASNPGTVSIYTDRSATEGVLKIGTHASGASFTVKSTFTKNGNLLLGGLTTDGTGVLQFAAATTNAGGITFGTDVNLFRTASGVLQLAQSQSGATGLVVLNNNTAGYAVNNFQNSTSRSIDLGVGGATVGITALRSKLYAYDNTSSFPLFLADGPNGWSFYANNTVALTLDSSQNATFAGAYIGSTDTRSGPGAVSVTKETTKVTTTGTLDALTLANGTDGQTKIVVHDVDGGSFVLTPTTKTGWSSFTSTVVGETITLKYVTTRGWMVIGNYLGTIAP